MSINPIHKAPYTNFHDLNLDWIMETLNEFNTKLTNFVSLATIKYADPIQWDITSQYEANTVVVDSNGNAYLSVQPVPPGVSLDRAEFWTKIGNFDALWADVKKAITPNDEGHSPTATAARAVNDLVWVNGALVRVTRAMITGDAYVPGSNCVSSSTNEVLHYLITAFNEGLSAEKQARKDADSNLQTAIDTEKQAREDADSNLQTAIDTEKQAREDADSNLQTAINTEKQAREDADNQLQKNIEAALKSSTNWANVKTYGAVGDGSTDDTSAFNAAKASGLPLYIPQGTFKVSGFESTQNVPVYIDGVIGGTISINGPIMAKNKQIFEAGSSVTIAKQYADGSADWFPDLQSAINTLHKVHLSNRTYTSSTNINIAKSGFSMVGPEYSDNGNGALIVLNNNSSIIVGDVTGRVINSFPRCITLENIEINSNDVEFPVKVYGVVYGTFRHLFVKTTSNTAVGGFYITKNVSTVYERCYVQSVDHGGSDRFRAYHCTDEGSPILAGGNASLYFVRCSYGDTYNTSSSFNSAGFDVIGAGSDVFLLSCETVDAGYGLSFESENATGDNRFNDILVSNCVFDGCSQGGIQFYKTAAGCVSIDNTYVACNTKGLFGLQFNECNGLTCAVNGLQLLGLGASMIGVQFVGNGANAVGNFITKGITNAFDGTPTNTELVYIHNGTLKHYPNR
jgi:hypothetical protein